MPIFDRLRPSVPTVQCCTQYLQHLLGGERPPDALAAEVVDFLQKEIERAIRRTRWRLPPRYFGFDGATWAEHFDTDNVPEVVTAFYLFLFAPAESNENGEGGQEVEPSQLNYLYRRVEQDWCVERLISTTLTNRFLRHLQQRHDRVGYAVYANSRAAIDAMVAAGELHRDWYDERGGRRTTADPPVRFPDYAGPVADVPAITHAVIADPDWPPLLHQLGRCSRRSQRALRERFASFPNYDVRAFTNEVVLLSVRDRVREASARWNAFPVEADPEAGVLRLFRTAAADWSEGSPPDLHVRCLRRLQHLHTLLAGGGGPVVAVLGELIRILEAGESVPSGAELGRRLSLDRRRVQEALTDLIERAVQLPDDE
jgi:hypothetical protein